jgi:uncharacterized protein YcnI
MRNSFASTILVLAAIVLLASAHVTVNPREAIAKRGGLFTINVPTERPVATTKIRVEFPANLRVSRIRSKLGWTAGVERDTSKAITAVTWTGGKIGPDEFDEFAFNARINSEGADTLVLKAYQTYEGGEVVGWTETVDPKAKHPAPKITVTAAPSKFATAAQDNWLGGVAMVLGLAALTVSMRNSKNGKSH